MPAPIRTPRSRFEDVIGRPEPDLDLAEAALLIAAEEYPQLEVTHYLRRLDLLAERVFDRLGQERASLLVLQELGKVLYEVVGLRGNKDAHYDPRNSFLNDVLDRRLGNPVTLSIIHLEVGRRLGLPLEGVNFPGHFLLRYRGEAVQVLVDPYHAGSIHFELDAQELLDRAYGGMIHLKPEFLQPTDKRIILYRLLTELKGIYLTAGDDSRALAVVERMLLVRPTPVSQLRDLGLLLARAGRLHEAIIELGRYLDSDPHGEDAERVRTLIRDLQRRTE